MTRSTDDIEPRHRLDYWIGAISEALFALSSSCPESDEFSSRMTAARLDDLYLIHTDGTARSSFRTPKGLATADDYSFHLVGGYREAMDVEWRGTRIRLQPGDLFLGDTRFVHSGRHLTSTVYIKIPPGWAQTWMRDPERFAGRRIPRDLGWGAALSTFVSQLSPQLAVDSPLPARLLSGSLGALLALAEGDTLSQPRTHQVMDRQLHDLVLDELRQRAGEAELTAVHVATSLNVPEMSIHRSLGAHGQTFSNALLQARIDTARRMLESAHFRLLTTAEIGRRAGFADPSYFVRVATRHLGMTPRRYRLATQT